MASFKELSKNSTEEQSLYLRCKFDREHVCKWAPSPHQHCQDNLIKAWQCCVMDEYTDIVISTLRRETQQRDLCLSILSLQHKETPHRGLDFPVRLWGNE